MTKEELEFDKILDKLDNETKNTLIKLLMTNDKENVWIETIPIYEDIMYQGHTVIRYIKECKYAVGVKHEAKNYPLSQCFTSEKQLEANRK